MSEISELLSKCIKIAINGGKIGLKYFRGGDLKFETKDDDTPVTIADQESNEYIVSELAKAFPKYTIIGEESVNEINEPLEKKTVFFVDPIDGTRAFILKKDEWSVIIGLCEKGIPIMGVVYQPVSGELYYAEKGKGSYYKKSQNEKEIKINVRKNVKFPQDIILCRSLTDPKEEVKKLKKHLNITKELPCGSYGVKCCRIARGLADVYLSKHSSYWDSAGSQVIVEEAGAKIYDLQTKEIKNYFGKDVKNRFTLCCTEDHYQNLLKAILDIKIVK